MSTPSARGDLSLVRTTSCPDSRMPVSHWPVWTPSARTNRAGLVPITPNGSHPKINRLEGDAHRTVPSRAKHTTASATSRATAAASRDVSESGSECADAGPGALIPQRCHGSRKESSRPVVVRRYPPSVMKNRLPNGSTKRAPRAPHGIGSGSPSNRTPAALHRS